MSQDKPHTYRDDADCIECGAFGPIDDDTPCEPSLEFTFNAFQRWAVSKLGGEHQEFACALGLAGEAGEVADLVKKDLCHGVLQAQDVFCKECGDVLYYLAVVAHQRGLRLSDVAAGNVRKLEARYPNGFNAADSIARRDENTTQTQSDAPKAPYRLPAEPWDAPGDGNPDNDGSCSV